ncbi:28S ribosomal protein S29, mitochondrial, partial [Nephila pilipes]
VHHTRDHIGKFYTIPLDVKNKLFFSGGIPKAWDSKMKVFCEAGIMIREPAIEILSLLSKINYSNPAVRFVIYGNQGTGKTGTLMHILHYAYESNFLLLHLPWVSNWTKRPKEVVASQYKEGRIDLPVESAIWLQHFKLQNSKLMEELNLKTSKSYTWSKREVTEEGASLMDILEHGVQRVRHSSDCIAALLREIKLHSQTGKFKVMVVVDGVNAFWCKTNVKRPDKSLVPPHEITSAYAFMKLLQNDWNNAVVITSVDILPFNRNASKQDPYTPHVMLGKEGFEYLDPFIPIETENYTEKEINSVLDYYCDRLWIQSERARQEDGRKQIKFLSGYNPEEVMKICDPL